jgi:hypothetical protein
MLQSDPALVAACVNSDPFHHFAGLRSDLPVLNGSSLPRLLLDPVVRLGISSGRSNNSLPRPTRLNHKAIDGSLSRHLVQMSLTIPLFMATRLRACTFASP